MSKRTILCVDEDPAALTSLARILDDSGLRLIAVPDTSAAEAHLAQKGVDMVIAAYRLPGMPGDLWLKRVKDRRPEAIRILSGQAEDAAQAVRAIVEGVAKEFIAKPWDAGGIMMHMDQQMEMRDVLSKRDLLKHFDGLEEMITLPAEYLDTIAKLNLSGDIDEMAESIERDPWMSFQILKIANSSYYGLSLGSVKQAITYLGILNIRNIILGMAVFRKLSQKKGAGGKMVSRLWRQSSLCNKVAQHLYMKAKDEHMPEEFATAGLLHDVGILLLLNFYPAKYREVLHQLSRAPERSPIDVENEVIDLNHGLLGAFLMDWWNMPMCIVETCLQHHDPLADHVMHKDEIAAIHLADALSWGIIDGPLPAKARPEAYAHLSLDEADTAREIMENFGDEIFMDEPV